MIRADREICPFHYQKIPCQQQFPNFPRPGCKSSPIATRPPLPPSGGAYGWVQRF
jgi:hypothetical protein